MRVPYQDCFHLIEPLLAKVEKPSRYIDHEWGTLSKADADYRCCMIYPDVYEVGLPNQGIAILYNILNQAEGISCERGYVPWPDMGDAMREAGIPLLSLEGAAPVASFDIVGMHVPHEMAVTNFLEALDLAGIPLLAADRTEDDPIIVAGGPSVYNPEPYAAFFDAILIGEVRSRCSRSASCIAACVTRRPARPDCRAARDRLRYLRAVAVRGAL